MSQATSPKSPFRNLEAILDTQPLGAPRLRVTGEYFLDMRSGGVSVAEASPQGFNPDILLLDLVKGKGDGGDWLPFRFDRPDTAVDAYSSISISDADGNMEHADIEIVS
jgi:hypothetical protein